MTPQGDTLQTLERLGQWMHISNLAYYGYM